jgi:glycosyltransferase involved in cell wall biosynthesis
VRSVPGQRRRLCIVNPFQHGGGAEYQISCLVDVPAILDVFDVYYLARHVDASIAHPHYQLVKIGSSHNAPRFGYLMDALPLHRALAQIRPDTIYQRVAGGYTGISAWYARRNGSRLIWHIAHDSDVSPDRSFYGRNPIRGYLEKASVEYAIRRAGSIVAQTRDQSQAMANNYGRSADIIIPNFHPFPAEDIDKSGPLTVVWVANLKPMKRPDAFVRLAARLQHLPEVRFVMVGSPAESENSQWVKTLMQAIAAAPNLEYVGRLPQDQVNQLLARSHLFVNTSDQEGFPNTFIQSWMRGVPVVSLSVNPDNILNAEQVGSFAGSEGRLADEVAAFLTDKDKLAMYSRRVVEYAQERHSLQNASLLAEFLVHKPAATQ